MTRAVDDRNEQEAFWSGEFGDAYAERNRGAPLLASNLAFFARALRAAGPLRSCIEFGANVGMNLRALQSLYPRQELHAVEINATAAAELGSIIPPANTFNQSLLEFDDDRTWDLVLVKGVLIHQAPETLPRAYDVLFRATGEYLLVAEYYNPVPVEVPYRGHAGKLFKRDFAGEFCDRHPSLALVDYGFCYHRDSAFPQDDITWFLMRRNRGE